MDKLALVSYKKNSSNKAKQLAYQTKLETSHKYFQSIRAVALKRGYTVLVPKGLWTEVGQKYGIPIITHAAARTEEEEEGEELPSLIKVLGYAEMVAEISSLLNELIEDPTKTQTIMEANGYTLYVPEPRNKNLVDKSLTDIYNLLLVEYIQNQKLPYRDIGSDITAVSAELYEAVDRRKNTAPVTKTVKMDNVFLIDTMRAFTNKFWPGNKINVYVLPRCDYSRLCYLNIPNGSYVVDCANGKIWPAFTNMSSTTPTTPFMVVNKSQLAIMPKVCPCSMKPDEDGYQSVYFLNADPIVIKGMFDCYNVNDREYGIETDVISLLSILQPAYREYDWEKNGDVLLQYMSVCMQLESEHMIKLIRKNVISSDKISPQFKTAIYKKLQQEYNFSPAQLKRFNL